MKTKLIRIKEDTITQLAKIGQFGQSYDDVIKKLMEEK